MDVHPAQPDGVVEGSHRQGAEVGRELVGVRRIFAVIGGQVRLRFRRESFEEGYGRSRAR